AKLTDASNKSEDEKRALSYRQVNETYATLKDLSERTPASLVISHDPASWHKTAIHKTCLYSCLLYWLKEDQLKQEYGPFKLAVSEKEFAKTQDEELRHIGQPHLARRRKKATSV